MRTFLRRTLPLLLFSLLSAGAPLPAQTLAHPRWVGNGVTIAPWWERAVFYHLDPALFQDSDGDGRGDLGGVVERMGYLQSLGVDALVVDVGDAPATAAAAPAPGFDDVVREATGRHLHVLAALRLEDHERLRSDAQLLAMARSWLTQGAAGIFLDLSPLGSGPQADPARAASLLHQMRALLGSVPGNRILIAAAGKTSDPGLLRALQQEPQLAVQPVASGAALLTAADLRRELQAALATTAAPGSLSGNASGERRGQTRGAGGTALLLVPRTALQGAQLPLDLALGAAVLGSRAAVLLEFGQELGEAPLDGRAAPMQWTASNLTPLAPPPPRPQPQVVAPSDPNVYQPYRPLVKVPRPDLLPRVSMPDAVLTDEPPPPDPAMAPGFTTAAHTGLPLSPNGEKANVAAEDADPGSILNLYRRLIQLHHDDPALHSGTQTLLDEDALDALVWLRQAPGGGRAPGSVVAVCNLSAQPLHLSLDDQMLKLHLRGGALRNLLSLSGTGMAGSGPERMPAVQDTGALAISPFGVFLGELYH